MGTQRAVARRFQLSVALAWMLAASVASCVAPCQQLANASNGLQEKVKPCDQIGGGGTIYAPPEITPAQVESCERDCSDGHDDSLIEAAAGCFAQIPACDPADAGGYVLGSIACAQKLQDLTADCRNGVAGGDM